MLSEAKAYVQFLYTKKMLIFTCNVKPVTKFLKILTKKAKKNHFLAKISVFWSKNTKKFKNKKLIK